MRRIGVVAIVLFLTFFPELCGADIDFSAYTNTNAVISPDTNKDFDGIAF